MFSLSQMKKRFVQRADCCEQRIGMDRKKAPRPYGVFLCQSGWTTAARRESSSSWCPVSSLTRIMDSSNTQPMIPTLCRSAPCQPSWTTTMTGESVLTAVSY